MDNRVDFFQRKLYNTRSFTRQRRKSRVRICLIIVVLVLLGFAGWKIFWAPVNLNDYDEGDRYDTSFSLGDQVYLQGEIKMEGTLNPYTIDDLNYGKFGIQSDSINFYDYVGGYVDITGIVIKKPVQSYPIVRVLSLSGTLVGTDEPDTNIVLDDNSGVYILGAGIQFLPDFFDEYVLLNEGENGEIRIQNIESGNEIVLNYFRCNSSDPNRNCKGLTETFENNQAQSFTTSEEDKYYKQSEVQSWFVANGDWRGIFINDVPDDVVYKLKDLMKFANEKNMKEWIRSRAMKICQGSGEKLQSIIDSDISLKQEGLVVTVSGNGLEKQMTCQILVDFSLPSKGVLKSLSLGDDVVIDEDKDEENIDEKGENKGFGGNLDEENKAEETIFTSNFVLDTSVPQFPLKEEGGLVYDSTRGGYSLQFPSSNISYVVSPIKENFGRSDISCSHVISAIKYSEKENLEVSPSIRIYECLGTVSESWAPEILVYPRVDKIFVVQVSDSSWWDFANHLEFTTLE